MKKQYLTTLISSSIIILMISVFVLNSKKKEKILIDKINIEFPFISVNQSYNGTITDVYHGDLNIFRNDPHQAYITLNNSQKVSIKVGYELSSRELFDEIVKVGFKVFKEANDYKIILLDIKGQDTTQYIFELRDELGYPLKKK